MMRSVRMRVQGVGAVALAVVTAVSLAGCGGGKGPGGVGTSTSTVSTTTTTPPPPPVDLDTAAKVQEALGAACAGEGADFNQKGMEVGGVEHKACATAENGDTNSIVYSWTSATEPATLSSNTQQQTKDYLQRGMPVCLIESAEHKWALQVFDTKTVGKPANIMSEVDRGHATVAAGTC